MMPYRVTMVWTDCNGNRQKTVRTVEAWSAEEAEKHARAMYPTIKFNPVFVIMDTPQASASLQGFAGSLT